MNIPNAQQVVDARTNPNDTDIVAFRYRGGGKDFNADIQKLKSTTLLYGILSTIFAGTGIYVATRKDIAKGWRITSGIAGAVGLLYAGANFVIRSALNTKEAKKEFGKIESGDVIIDNKKSFERLYKSASAEDKAKIEILDINSPEAQKALAELDGKDAAQEQKAIQKNWGNTIANEPAQTFALTP